MPHITTAMERSLRRGVTDLVFDSLLGRRQTAADRVESVKTTFSSWDGCMAKTYCKWPVIAGIVIGGLVIFSIVSCIVRCCCCGMSCCCSCFSFLKCCDCCGGACDGKKNKKMKHLDDPYAHHGGPSSGYQAPASMPVMAGGLQSKPAPPQYAQFEVGSNGLAVSPKPLSEDALPPMPSWEGAQKKHVPNDEKDAVELGNLDPATGQRVPLMSAGAVSGASVPPSPIHEMHPSPYGARPGHGGSDGYMGAGAVDPYGQNQNSFNGNGAYGAPSSGPSRGYGSPPPQDAYGQPTNFVAAAVPGGYNQRPHRQNTGDLQYQNPSGQQYPPQSPRQYSGNSARPHDRQYSDYPENYNNQAPRGASRGPPNRMASPPVNNAGFEFGANNNQSYSRPGNHHQQQQSYNSGNHHHQQQQQQPSYNSGRRPSLPRGGNEGYGNEGYSYDSTSAPSYSSRSPPSQEPSYSDFQAYQAPQPVSNHNRAPTALRPGRDPRQQPQGWDPVNH